MISNFEARRPNRKQTAQTKGERVKGLDWTGELRLDSSSQRRVNRQISPVCLLRKGGESNAPDEANRAERDEKNAVFWCVRCVGLCSLTLDEAVQNVQMCV